MESIPAQACRLESIGDFCGNTILYSYNESGIHFGKTNLMVALKYYYVKNGQGDVIGFINGAGAIVVNYTYDSWARLQVCKE